MSAPHATHRSLRRSVARRVAATAAAVVPLALVASASHAVGVCQPVDGSYVERDASAAGCASPVGLCIAGTYAGDLVGPFVGTATTISPNVDTATTSVLAFTSDSTISARMGRRSGTLLVKNAGAFRLVGDGSIVDLQTIVGGTGDFAGASGDLRASGVFSQATGGRSTYRGSVCLPRP